MYKTAAGQYFDTLKEKSTMMGKRFLYIVFKKGQGSKDWTAPQTYKYS